jgi:hypothetical protein
MLSIITIDPADKVALSYRHLSHFIDAAEAAFAKVGIAASIELDLLRIMHSPEFGYAAEVAVRWHATIPETPTARGGEIVIRSGYRGDAHDAIAEAGNGVHGSVWAAIDVAAMLADGGA